MSDPVMREEGIRRWKAAVQKVKEQAFPERMPFGKHRGELIVDLPYDYLHWVVNHSGDKIDQSSAVYRVIAEEYDRRWALACF